MAKTQNKSPMRAVIFAGGVGTRMWPLSRKTSPKQFEKIVGDQSTLQLAVQRIRPEFDWHNIYISTGIDYLNIIKSQVPNIPKQNIIAEPQMRDVAAAVGYVTAVLGKKDPHQPFAILWSDHLIKNTAIFKKVLRVGGEYIAKHKNKILFIGQKSRFPNQNLGWIRRGEQATSASGFKIYKFKGWHYRPSLKLAQQYFKNPNFSWNPGYFVSTPKFILDQYQNFMPDMYQVIKKLAHSWGSDNHSQNLSRLYPKMEKISFDNAILERIKPEQAIVLTTDMGWSDIGAWEAFKEALQTKPQENITHGKTHLHNNQNSLVYNYTSKLVTTIDIKDMLVIVTDDVILVCPQESVPEIKKVVQGFKSSANEKYT